VLEFVINYI